MMNKTVLIVVMLMFALALGAGVVAGKLSSRLPAAEPAPPSRGTLADVLHLTPDQQAKMAAVWEGVRDTSRNCIADAEKVQRDLDQARMAMLTDEQRKKYQELSDAASGKIAEIDAKRKQAFKKAVEETNGHILDESQRKIYDQIIKDRVGDVPDGRWETP